MSRSVSSRSVSSGVDVNMSGQARAGVSVGERMNFKNASKSVSKLRIPEFDNESFFSSLLQNISAKICIDFFGQNRQ